MIQIKVKLNIQNINDVRIPSFPSDIVYHFVRDYSRNISSKYYRLIYISTSEYIYDFDTFS